jgi:hypothetical protein
MRDTRRKDCETCRHSKVVGVNLCCAHPSEKDRPGFGLRAAVVVHRARCGGKGRVAR